MIPTLDIIYPDLNQLVQDGPVIYLLNHTQAKVFGADHGSATDEVFIIQIFEAFSMPAGTINVNHDISCPRIATLLTKKTEPSTSWSWDNSPVHHVPHPGAIEGHIGTNMNALVILDNHVRTPTRRGIRKVIPLEAWGPRLYPFCPDQDRK